MIGSQRDGYALVALLLCSCMLGCGGGERRVRVTGKVVDGGKPFVIENWADYYNCLKLEFFRLAESGDIKEDSLMQEATVQQDGSFEVLGETGDGIPVGKYRVAVYRMGEMEGATDDIWDGKFGPENSPFTFDVTGDQEITIDLQEGGGPGPAVATGGGEDED